MGGNGFDKLQFYIIAHEQEQTLITCSLIPEDYPLDFILVLLQLVLNVLLHTSLYNGKI